MKTFTCTVPACGATKTSELAVDPENHADYGTSLVNAKAAACNENGYTGDVICNGCRAVRTPGAVISKDTVPHTWSAWTVTKAPSYLHGGEEARRCGVCGLEETNALGKLIPDETKTDGETGSQLGFQSGVLPTDTNIVVNEEFDGAYFRVLNREKGNVKNKRYNITLESDGVKVQPSGKMLVRLRIPEGFNPGALSVYYITTDGVGKTELIESYVEGGYIYFETTHFSVYAIVDESQQGEAPEPEPEPEPEPNCACGQYHTGIFAGVIKFFHSILYFFKNLFRK